MPISVNLTYRANLTQPLSWAQGDANFKTLADNDVWLNDNKQPLSAKLTGITNSATTYGLTLLNYADANALKVSLLLDLVNNTSDTAKPISNATQNALNQKINLADRDVPGGIATLDGLGKLKAANFRTAIAALDGLTPIAGRVPIFTTGTTAAMLTTTTTGQELLAAADKAAGRSILELVKQVSRFDSTTDRVLLTGAGGLLGEAGGFDGNIDDRAAVPFGTCFISPNGTGTKPAGVSYGLLVTKASASNQGTHQELYEVTGASGVTMNTWHRDQFGSAGAWGPWRRRYSTNNILGTVAQVSGVPTGAIIERGSNTNGEYIRYADGTQICWKRVGTGTITQASGNIFLCASSVGAGAFPAAFSAIPNMTHSACVQGYSWAVWSANAVEPTVSNWGNYFGAAAASISQGVIINLIAIGRWY